MYSLDLKISFWSIPFKERHTCTQHLSHISILKATLVKLHAVLLDLNQDSYVERMYNC